MAAEKWADAYARERVYEGGNVNNPKDPGGRTSRGVTQRVYDAYRRRKSLRPMDVYKASDAEVQEIFKVQYWDAVQGDTLPAGLDLVALDGAINSGPKQSIKWVQAGLNAKRTSGNIPVLVVDGVLGQSTLDAVEANMDNDALIAEILAIRLGFLHRLHTWSEFGKGWSARVANLKKIGQAWATGSVGPKAIKVSHLGGNEKAPPTDLKTLPVSVQAGAATTGGALSLAGVSDAVGNAAGQVQVVSDLSSILHWLFIGLTVVGVGLTLYAAWRLYRGDQAKAGETYRDVPEHVEPHE